MFYSHEILTSRKHGVATVWLVATLGSKSSLKKVSRRAILDVNVPQACETIANPDSPMALRLQSSLLFGVSRVFSQQCGYILTDSQGLHDKMRGVRIVMRDLQIDTNLASTKSEQLNLPMDPAFDFDLDMGLDFSAFDLGSEITERSSLLSPHTHVSSQSSLRPEEEVFVPQIDLLSADTPANDYFGFDLNAGKMTSSVQRLSQHVGADLEEPGIDIDPSFVIDDDGMIVDRPQGQMEAGDIIVPDLFDILDGNLVFGDDDVGASAAVSGTPGEFVTGLHDDNILLGDDDDIIPHSPVQSRTPGTHTVAAASEQRAELPSPATVSAERDENTFTAEAPQRRTRIARKLQIDQITELSNRQLTEWDGLYAETMAHARFEKASNRSVAQAKRNAMFWVLDQGIGGVSVNFGDDRESHPLTIFSGPTLMHALTGQHGSLAGRKRSLSDALGSEVEDDEGEEARRIRSGSERDVGRGMNSVNQTADDDGILFQDDDDIEMQIGRQPASSLKDQPSSMPWNLIPSSRQGSSRGSALPGISSSLRGIGFNVGPHPRTSGRRSRLTSASPLFGRGRPLSRLGSLDPQENERSLDLDTADFADPFIGGTTEDLNEDFELYAPAAMISTQQAAQNHWLAAALENEAQNFLLFLNQQIADTALDGDADPSITFAQLLPPEQNSYVVAAQGILHVLALATKGLIQIQQDEAFGEIILSSVVATSADDGNDEVESDVEVMEDA